METRSVKKSTIQATGSFDILANEYSFTICSGSLVVSFDFLNEDDIREIISCLSCMLVDDDTITSHEQCQADLDNPGS